MSDGTDKADLSLQIIPLLLELKAGLATALATQRALQDDVKEVKADVSKVKERLGDVEKGEARKNGMVAIIAAAVGATSAWVGEHVVNFLSLPK